MGQVPQLMVALFGGMAQAYRGCRIFYLRETIVRREIPGDLCTDLSWKGSVERGFYDSSAPLCAASCSSCL